MTLKTIKSFPKEIAVVIEDAGTNDLYLNAQESANDFAAVGETRTVAFYQLVAVKKVRCTVEVV